MRIGTLSYTPYVYNTNYVSAESLNKISAIDDDLVTSGTDYSSLTDDSLNENPLQRGQTSNFADVIAMQFQMSQINASRLIKPAEEMQQSAEMDSRRDQYMKVQEPTVPEPMQEEEAVTEPVQNLEAVASLQQDRNLFAMQRAAEAYRVNMIA